MSPDATHTPADTTWSAVLTELTAGRDLPAATAAWAMDQVMSGHATAGQIGAFLMALRAKGESADEVAVFVEQMLRHAVPVTVGQAVVDTCGTGGDGLGTVNISTMSAIVVAACGVPVVKHGNRAASSASGSADVLEALGIRVTLPPDAVAACLDRAGIAFCFAPAFHPAMKHAGPVRRELGVPTVFNVLGPLANPARPAAQLVGVASARMAPVVASALAQRGSSALVVRGDDGLDEVSTMAPTHIWDATGSTVVERVIDVADFGVPRAAQADLAGGDPVMNATIAEQVLAAGSTAHPAVRDAVVVNTSAALIAAGAAGTGDFEQRFRTGMAMADAALRDGRAATVLARWRAASNESAA